MLGTDQLGRDVLSQILLWRTRFAHYRLWGLQSCLGVIGVTLGAMSGFYTGKVDLLIQKSVEVSVGISALLFAIALIAFFGPKPAKS